MYKHYGQDAIARWRRMSGYHVSWIPGTDHAGIGTQSVVERKLFKERNVSFNKVSKNHWLLLIFLFYS
jgi:valyl-tRNA synthetase